MTPQERRERNAILVFMTKSHYADNTDADIRTVIKTLQEMIAERQRQRAAKKHIVNN